MGAQYSLHVCSELSRTTRNILIACMMIWSSLSLISCSNPFLETNSHMKVNRHLERNQNLETYPHNGFICIKCPRGTQVARHCDRNFTKSTCKDCEEGYYQPNSTRFESCLECDTFCRHQGIRTVVKVCNRYHNLECRCPEGQILKKLNTYSQVFECQPCPDGYTLVKKAKRDLDTCAPCPNNTFKDSAQRRCVECTSCLALNKTEVRPCNITSDSVCENNSWINQKVTDWSHRPTDRPTVAPNSFHTAIIAIVGTVLALAILAVVVLVIMKCFGRRGSKTVRDMQPLPDAEMTLLTPSTIETEGCVPHSPIGGSVATIFPDLDADIWNNPIFNMLSTRLKSWKAFMRRLPGNAEFCETVDCRCEQIQMEVTNDVREQIYRALTWWYQSNESSVATIDAILNTLDEMGLDELYQAVKDNACALARQSAHP